MTASAGTGLAEASPRPRPVDDGSRGRDATVRANAAIGGLIWTLIRTDFKARYHGTLSGFVWALLKPTAMFVVLVAVFSFVFRGEPNYKLNLILGLFLWDFFADATKTGMTSLAAKGFLVTKARFPRWIVVVTSIANAFITLVVFAAIVTTYLAVTGHAPSLVALAAFALYILALATIAVGISLASSVLFLRFRDLNQIWDMAMQAGFFVAPIVYPVGVIPERFHFYLYLWPPTPIIEFSRSVLDCRAFCRRRPGTCAGGHDGRHPDSRRDAVPAVRAARRGVRVDRMARPVIEVDSRLEELRDSQRAARDRTRAPLRRARAASLRAHDRARQRELRRPRRRDARHHGPQRLRQEHAAEDPLRDLHGRTAARYGCTRG